MPRGKGFGGDIGDMKFRTNVAERIAYLPQGLGKNLYPTLSIFENAEQKTGDEQRKLYEQAASELVRAVNDEPNHPQAPLALEKAAIARIAASPGMNGCDQKDAVIDPTTPALLMLRPVGL